MATIQENLQTLRDIKSDLKSSLEAQSKEPTNQFVTYSDLVDTLENPDEITYCVTLDGENKAYAQLHGEEEITLTATANDIRINTSAITDVGYTEGTKEIPAYVSHVGKKIILAGNQIMLTIQKYDYTELQVNISYYNSSLNESVEVFATSIDDSVYETKSTNKLADITIDHDTMTIDFGITAEQKVVLRYFTMKEE